MEKPVAGDDDDSESGFRVQKTGEIITECALSDRNPTGDTNDKS